MRQICDYGKEAGTMVKVGIIGATGYAGQELVRILLGHKDARSSGMVPEVISIRNTHLYIGTCFS